MLNHIKYHKPYKKKLITKQKVKYILYYYIFYILIWLEDY